MDFDISVGRRLCDEWYHGKRAHHRIRFGAVAVDIFDSAGFSADDSDRAALELESAVYARFSGDANAYHIAAKRILEHLDPKSVVGSTRLLDMIRTGENGVYARIAAMRADDICPEYVERIRGEIDRRMGVHIHQKTFELKCPNCYERLARIEYKQTRSLDEPATAFATCTNCRHSWRPS
jgi:DNA-directed RNA polymerase subunit M/transcription elongation factor TFIIS